MEINGKANMIVAQNTLGSKSSQSDKDAKLKASCREMESVFLDLLLKQMRQTVPKSELMSKSSGEETMQSMLDGEVTKDMAKAGGMGLADLLYRQLSERVSVNNKSQAPR
ncbi:MAG: Flagellar protein FlgJ [Firmicutes bacterium]|nr:Flagellar protein FlgJ [Bacillota bacterium]